MRGARSDRGFALSGQEDAREALRRSEERYALAIAGSKDGIWEWDLATDAVYLSPRCQELLGRLSDGVDIRDKNEWLQWHDYLPDDTPLREAAMRDHFSGRTPWYEGEWRVRHPDGSPHWLHCRGVVTRDEAGKPLRFAGSISDIDARKRVEESLRRTQSYLTEALRLGGAGSFAFDVRQKRYVHWSTELYSIWGLDPSLGPPTVEQLFDRVHADDVERVSLARSQALAAQMDYDIQYRIRRPDGSVRHVHVVGHALLDDLGERVEMVGTIVDITERMQAEAALRKSEERFALAVAGTNEGIFDWDVATDRVYMSLRAQEMFGLQPGEPTRSRREWYAVARPAARADEERVGRALVEHLTGRSPTYVVEYAVALPGGQVRWICQRGLGLRDSAGKVHRMAGSFEDITDRKATADALRENEARFRSLTEVSSDWYWRQDENLRFTQLSSGISELAGWSADIYIGRTRWEVPDLTLLSCSWPEHKGVLAARKPFRDLEYSRPGKDGLTQYSSISGTPMFDETGRFMGYQGVGRNITERKRIEEELRSRQAMLDLAQQAARAVAFDLRVDTPDRLNRWTPEHEELYGLAPGSFDGTFKGWKRLVHAEDWPSVREALKRAAATGEVSLEYRVIHTGGAVRWLQAKGKMLFGDEGGPDRLVGFLLDVTDRHEAEDKLLSLERQLRQSQRLEAMGTLAGGIAHDFNNILSAVLGFGEMALRDAPEGSRLRRDLDCITVAGERGRALVERILAFSRSGVGDKVAVHVEKVVRESIDLLTASLPPRVTIEADLRAGSAAMRGDPTQVHQVVMNLATNGIQAMAGGGTLRISLGELHLDAPRAAATSAVAAGEYILLKVADGGSGIPAEILDRIFDPFFTTKGVGVGTGLGLSLVHGIVTELGGAIEVETGAGEGSVFIVYLPRAGNVVEGREDEMPEPPRGNGQRVLIVDDEEPLVRLATRTIEELGYVPEGFTSSAAALEAFRANPDRFDAVITDERMPGLSGSALIAEMRAIRRSIPILLVSGYLGGTAADADEILQKPLSTRALATSLARALLPK
jgi:PAS domain S-box-containing protein